MQIVSYIVIWFGIVLWFYGTFPLLGDRSVLYKLHGLSIADTLGSMAIIVGLLLQRTREWPLMILALISLALWNTILGYVLAYCSTDKADREELFSGELSGEAFSMETFGNEGVNHD